VINALKHLVKTPLFIKEKITVSEEWLRQVRGSEKYDFISKDDVQVLTDENEVEQDPAVDDNKDISNTMQVDSTEQGKDEKAYLTTIDEEDEEQINYETFMRYDITQLNNIQENENGELEIVIAPCEGNNPMSHFKDPYAENLAYIGLEGGQEPPEYYNKLSRNEMYKFQLKHYDRRYAACQPRIFNCYKTAMAETIAQQIKFRLKKDNFNNLTGDDCLNHLTIE